MPVPRSSWGGGAVAAIEWARDALLSIGAVERAAEAETRLADSAWLLGQRDAANAHLERAQALIAEGDSLAGTRPRDQRGVALSCAGGPQRRGDRVGGQALAMADAFELDEVRAHALDNISIAKQSLGDRTGDDDLARSIEIARAANSIAPADGRSTISRCGLLRERRPRSGRGAARGSDRSR